MPRFSYMAFDKAKNRKISGETESSSQQSLRSELTEKGLYVIRIEEQRASGTSFKMPRLFKSVSSKELLTFFKSLMLSVRAGVSLGQVFECLIEQTASEYFKEVLRDVHSGITKGKALSECFRGYNKVFPDDFVTMVEAGESAGKLAEVLEEYTNYVEEARKLKGEIIGALAYPMIIVIVAIIAVLGLTLYIFPTFMKAVGIPMAKMPFITQVVWYFSTTVLDNWPSLLAGGVVVFFGGGYFFNRVRIGIRTKFWLQLHIPIVADLYKKMNLAHFSRTMSLQSKSGVASVSALQLTARSMPNIYYKELVEDIIDTIKRGGTYIDALKKRPKMITPLVVLLISVGEQTGTFDEVLGTIATYYSDEVRVAVKAMASMIEPLMIVFMGISVGTIAASMFLPLFDLVNQMG